MHATPALRGLRERGRGWERDQVVCVTSMAKVDGRESELWRGLREVERSERARARTLFCPSIWSAATGVKQQQQSWAPRQDGARWEEGRGEEVCGTRLVWAKRKCEHGGSVSCVCVCVCVCVYAVSRMMIV